MSEDQIVIEINDELVSDEKILTEIFNEHYINIAEKSSGAKPSSLEDSADTVKPLNSGQLRVLKNLSVIKRCPLLGDSLTKIVTFGTKHFVRYSSYVRYLGCPLLRGFTVLYLMKLW